MLSTGSRMNQVTPRQSASPGMVGRQLSRIGAPSPRVLLPNGPVLYLTATDFGLADRRSLGSMPDGPLEPIHWGGAVCWARVSFAPHFHEYPGL